MKRTHAEWLKDVDQLGQEMSDLLQRVLNHKILEEVAHAKSEEHNQRIKQLKEELEAGFR